MNRINRTTNTFDESEVNRMAKMSNTLDEIATETEALPRGPTEQCETEIQKAVMAATIARDAIRDALKIIEEARP